jgi:hypothetical protein
LGVVSAWSSDFLFVAEIGHFAIKKGPKQHGEENFLENFLKNCHLLWKKKVMRILKFYTCLSDL